MLRKNQRPFNFTTGQVHQLKQIDHGFRQFNRIARAHLRRIKHLDLNPRQYYEAGESLEMVTTRMTSSLRFRQEIVRVGQQQQPLLIVMHFCMLCDCCSERRRLTERDEDETGREALKPDPAHLAEIDSLLVLTSQIEELVSTRSTLRRASLNTFLRQISCFRLAVLKQRRHYQATTLPGTIQVEFEDEDPNGPNICADCHCSMEIDETTKIHDHKSDDRSSEDR